MTRKKKIAPTKGAERPVSPTHLHASVSRALGVAIIAGKLEPGAILPSEDVHSERLGVGRSAYREAIRFLAAKGLVDSRRKRGTRVLARRHWNFLDPDVLAWFFEASPSEAFIRNLLELRLIFEPAAAELAARHRRDEDLQLLRAALGDMQVAPFGSAAGRDAGSRFHRGVLIATQNEVLASLGSSIDAAMLWTLTFLKRRRVEIADPFRYHERLYRALVRQDTAAAREQMRRIVSEAYEMAYGSASDISADRR